MGFVEVHDWQVKPGGGEKIVALIQAAVAQFQPPQGISTPWTLRAYAPTWSRFVMLIDWNSYADQERWYEAFSASPAGEEYWRKVVEFPISQRDEHWAPLETPANWATMEQGAASIVEVHDWQVRPGGAEQVLAVVQASFSRWQVPTGIARPLSMRGYMPSWTRVVLMAEWRSFSDMEQWYAAFGQSPVSQDHYAKMQELMVSANTGGWEFWTPLWSVSGGQAA